ncbi:hypothetical protein [Prevotella sp. 10(H)]|uniref:hypothetical protein n=1 Tax=Prevotella sp. 10(H) TaxID=1158294 RepID=UPI0004A7199B|nr:hypothetical protein [Prevotella sp. 10(H)]
MNIDDKDKLRSLFQEIEQKEPSSGFEDRLMQRVHILSAKESKKKNLKAIFAIIGGIAGMLGIPAFIFWWFGFSLKTDFQPIDLDISFNMPDIKFDPFIISIACVVLLLLISDTLIRRRIWEKKHKH